MRAIGTPGIEKRHKSGAFFARNAGSYNSRIDPEIMCRARLRILSHISQKSA